ncbi:MAG: XRE family transcriptional regulator [Nitrospinota bacterium]|nr:XRE family transcriptional regulator [Nitrospinota bacterium]
MSIRKVELIRTKRVNKKNLAKRIKSLRGGESLLAFGKRLGVSHTTIKRYEEGVMLPSADILMRLVAISSKSIEWILTGNEPPVELKNEGGGFSAPMPPRQLSEEEYFSVPLVDGEIAAGEPIIAEENVIEWVVVHVRPLKVASAKARDLVACRVSGESMWPHLASGDIVVIDRGADRERIQKGRIYAVQSEGGVTAKLLERDGHNLFLIPVNTAEKIRIVDLRENSSPIVGLVIGGWKNFTRPI